MVSGVASNFGFIFKPKYSETEALVSEACTASCGQGWRVPQTLTVYISLIREGAGSLKIKETKVLSKRYTCGRRDLRRERGPALNCRSYEQTRPRLCLGEEVRPPKGGAAFLSDRSPGKRWHLQEREAVIRWETISRMFGGRIWMATRELCSPQKSAGNSKKHFLSTEYLPGV